MQPLSPPDVLEASSHAAETAAIAAEIHSIYTRISSLEDLNPRAEVNALFSRLVALCIKPYHPAIVFAVLSNPAIAATAPHLRQLCSSAEGTLERYWANRMLRFDEKLGLPDPPSQLAGGR
jgi:nicotianamine synthase